MPRPPYLSLLGHARKRVLCPASRSHQTTCPSRRWRGHGCLWLGWGEGDAGSGVAGHCEALQGVPEHLSQPAEPHSASHLRAASGPLGSQRALPTPLPGVSLLFVTGLRQWHCHSQSLRGPANPIAQQQRHLCTRFSLETMQNQGLSPWESKAASDGSRARKPPSPAPLSPLACTPSFQICPCRLLSRASDAESASQRAERSQARHRLYGEESGQRSRLAWLFLCPSPAPSSSQPH